LSRDLPRSGSKPGDSMMPDTPHAQGLLPVPGRSRASALLQLGAACGRLMIESKMRRALAPDQQQKHQVDAAPVGARLPAIYRAAVANQATRFCLTLRMQRSCCRCLVDRGQGGTPPQSLLQFESTHAVYLRPVGVSSLTNAACHSALMYLTHRIRCPRNLGRLPRVSRRRRNIEQASDLCEPACWRMWGVIHRIRPKCGPYPRNLGRLPRVSQRRRNIDRTHAPRGHAGCDALRLLDLWCASYLWEEPGPRRNASAVTVRQNPTICPHRK
jgi:hypothetical protein